MQIRWVTVATQLVSNLTVDKEDGVDDGINVNVEDLEPNLL